MTDDILRLAGKKFIVYDYDNTPIAKGWIMEGEEIIEKIDASDHSGPHTVESKKIVIKGDITHWL